MGLASSSGGTSADYIPGLQAGERWKFAGINEYDSLAALVVDLNKERNNVDGINGASPIWRAGMRFRVIGEAADRVYFQGSSGALSNVWTIALGQNRVQILGSDTATCTSTSTFPPPDSAGANGNMLIDGSRGIYWLKAAGTWGSPFKTTGNVSQDGLTGGLTGPGGKYDPRRQAVKGLCAYKTPGELKTNSAAGYTFHSSFWVPFAFYAVEVRLTNMLAAAWTGVDGAIAVTNSFNSSALLVNPSTTTWVPFATAATVPAAASGGGTQNYVAGTLDSGVIALNSIASIDTGGGQNVMVRVRWASGNGTVSEGYTTNVGIPAAVPSRSNQKPYTTYKNGDFVTTNQGGMDGTAGIQFQGPPCEFIFHTANGLKSIHFDGDSIVEQYKDTSAFGWVMQLANAGAGSFTPFNKGATGRTSNTVLANFVADIPRIRPHMAVFCPFSSNDTDKYTTAGEQRQMLSIRTFIALCDQYGVIPVFTTPTPVGGLTAPQETSRRLIAAAVRNLSSQFTVIDFDNLLTDYTVNTGGWLVAGDAATSDVVHPSVQGHAKMATLAIATVWPVAALA